MNFRRITAAAVLAMALVPLASAQLAKENDKEKIIAIRAGRLIDVVAVDGDADAALLTRVKFVMKGGAVVRR